MKIYNNSTAFTLMEVIVASIVVGITVLGIIASNINLQKISKNISDNYYVIQNTNTSLNHILQNASKTVGVISSSSDASISYGFADGSGGYGVVLGKNSNDAQVTSVSPSDSSGNNTFCFNQTQGDPNDPNVAVWLCYTWDPNTYNIYWCKENSATACALDTSVLLGTAHAITRTYSISDPQDNTQQRVRFDVEIDNCLDNAEASCCNPDPNIDPNCKPDNNNPYIVRKGGVSPPGYSI